MTWNILLIFSLFLFQKHRQMFNYSLSLAWYPNLAQWSSKQNHNNNNNNQNTNHKSLHPNKSPFTLEWDQKTYEKQDLNHCNRILSPYGKRQKICYR